MKFAKKAFNVAQELFTLRKESNPDYEVVLAPFYYMIGHVLATYLENNTDALGGQVQELDYDDSDEEAEEVVNENEVEEAENGDEPSEEQNGNEESKTEEEPKIEEE